MSIEKYFLASAMARVGYYKKLADDSFLQLQAADYYYQPTAESNSIAIIIRHMAGNMLSRWTDFLHSDGEKEGRNRDAEFETNDWTVAELLAYWEKGWDCFLKALAAMEPADLLQTIYIRTEPLLLIDAVNRQLAHYPYHVGQIVYLARLIRGNDWKNLSIPKGHSQQFNEKTKSS